MSHERIREYAMRKAKEEAYAFISRQIKNLGDNAIADIVCHILDELNRDHPDYAYNLDFLDILTMDK